MPNGALNPNTSHLAAKWNYSPTELLYQELNDLIARKTCAKTYAKGLVFKPISNYSTLAGAYSGQPAWLMEVCHDGYIIHLADRHPEVVLKKAIYWFGKCFEQEGKEPSESEMAKYNSTPLDLLGGEIASPTKPA